MEHGDSIFTQGRSFALLRREGDPDELFATTLADLTEQLARAVDCHECCVYDYVRERDGMRAFAIWSRRLSERDFEWLGAIHSLPNVRDFQQFLECGEVVVAYPDDEIDSATSEFESMQYWGELATIWSPIVRNGEVLGILEITEKERPRQFTDAEKDLVRRMSSLAAIILHNMATTRAMEERNRQLTALIDSSRAMISTLDLDEVLDVVCRQTARALDAARSCIYEYDPDTDSIISLAHFQHYPACTFAEPPGTVYHLDELPTAFGVIRTRKPAQLRMDDPSLHPDTRAQVTDSHKQSSLIVPLVVGDAVVGALEVSETAYPRHFSDQETALSVALGEQAAAAIRNAQLYRRLLEQKETIEQQATTDDLTGLVNHRCFWARLREETARARRYGQPLSLIMLDLDDFKQVNDGYGHLFGDEVLRKVGEALRLHVRQAVDVPARYGGEEFAVILPSTDCLAPDGVTPNGASRTAERMRDAVAALRLPVEGGGWSGLTTSIGVATLPRHAGTAEDLVLKADAALYEAKRRGKDRVAICGGF